MLRRLKRGKRKVLAVLAITACVTSVYIYLSYYHANTMRSQLRSCAVEQRCPASNTVVSSTATTTAIKSIAKASDNTTSTTNTTTTTTTTTKPTKETTSALKNDLPDCFFDYKKVRPIVDVNTTMPTWTQLNSQFPMLSKGGHYKPTYCRPKHHLSIIIPYRNRENHLKLFLQHMHPFLQAQMHEYTVYVVEQEKGVMFNKALLMNAGFIEVSKQAEGECFLFHDIDMLPMNAGIDYTCHNGTVVHPTFYVRQYNFSTSNLYLGGALSFHKVDFRRVNGFSNLYWGWGGEDDDMYTRGEFVKKAVERMHEDGLNSANYTILRTEQRPLYTWIYVSANQSYQTDGSYKNIFRKYGPNSMDKIKGRGRVLPPQ